MFGMTTGARTSRRRRVTYPVENLRKHVSALESAIARVLAKPGKDAVHDLRSVTRKVEAHLVVFDTLGRQMPGFRSVESPAKRVKKLLDLIRRAAGRVRDLDVQIKMAQGCAASPASESLCEEVKEIRALLKTQREAAAAKLLEVLEGHGRKLGPRLEDLMRALQPVKEVGLSPVEQEVLTREWYSEQVSEARRETDPELALHAIRKAAKLARYMAEDGLATRVVSEFKALQEAGGQWHDCLCLRDAARQQLGKRSELAALMKQREAEARSSFETLVAG